jgi:hypothetical protein
MIAILLPITIAILLAGPSFAQHTPEEIGLLHPEGSYAFSEDMKQAILTFGENGPITPEVREHINRTRWSKGQHKLPEEIIGSRFDLNNDGTDELILETGTNDPTGQHRLVVRIENNRAEILLAFQGSFVLVKREGAWDDILVGRREESIHFTQTRWRHDGTQYRRISKLEKLTKESPLTERKFPVPPPQPPSR